MAYVFLTIGLVVAGVLALYLIAPRAMFIALRAVLRSRGGFSLRTVSVHGTLWPYLESGDRNGEPLVLVHGFGVDKDHWLMYAPHLGRRYHLICPDLPGFGENDRSLEGDYSIPAQASRLRDFLDALRIDTCHLGGISMGGAVALRFALDYPQRLRTLTLIDNGGVLGATESEVQQRINRGERPLVPRTLSEFEQLLTLAAHRRPFVPKRFKRVLFDDLKHHEPLLDKIFDQVVEDLLRRPLNDRLNEIKAPTLIIWGRHDRLIDVTCAIAQHEGIARSEMVIFDDAGHVPTIEKPAETARHQLAFLARH